MPNRVALSHAKQYSTVQYSTVLYCTVLYSTVVESTSRSSKRKGALRSIGGGYRGRHRTWRPWSPCLSTTTIDELVWNHATPCKSIVYLLSEKVIDRSSALRVSDTYGRLKALMLAVLTVSISGFLG